MSLEATAVVNNHDPVTTAARNELAVSEAALVMLELPSQNGSANQPAQLSELLQRYSETPTDEIRNEIVVAVLPIINWVAQRVQKNLPRSVDVADLVQEGVFGAMDAIDRYDSECGIKFETYLAPRVRGAMLDALRDFDWVPHYYPQVTILINLSLSLSLSLGLGLGL